MNAKFHYLYQPHCKLNSDIIKYYDKKIVKSVLEIGELL